MIVTSLLMISSLLTLARATPMSFTTYRRRELPVDEGAQLVLLYDQKGFENTDPSPRSVYDLERAYAKELALQQQRQHEMAEVGTSKMAVVNEALEEHGSIGGASRGAKKRAIGSLSIVNPVDVLRSRVLLELARRRMRQQEQQAAENRRILETIGKRSVHQLSSNPNDYTGNGIDIPSVSNTGVIYGKNERVNVRGDEKQRADQTQRIQIGMRSRDWYETGDNDIDDVDIVDNNDDDVAVTTRGNGDGNNTRKVAATYRQERI